MGWGTTLYDRIEDAPADEWASLSPHEADLAMDPRLLGAFQTTMQDQCRCWFAIVRDHHGSAVASAALCLFRIDALETTGPLAQSIARKTRKLLPGYMRFKVLFCGLPVPSADSHLRIRPGADRAKVLESLNEAMLKLARQIRARLIVMKEFDDTRRDELLTLEVLGYIRGDVPASRVLSRTFDSFDGYCGALRAPYRKQVTESLRKFDRAECTFEHLSGASIVDAMSERMHALYLNVRDRATYRMELLPREFFHALARRFDDDAAITIIRGNNEILGWAFSLTRGGECHNLYIGLDYDRNTDADVYFNLHFRDLDRAFRRSCTRIHLGQTSDEFKSRLGCDSIPLSFYVRAVNPLIHWGLRRFSRMVFPPVAAPKPSNVFRATSAPERMEKTRVSSADAGV